MLPAACYHFSWGYYRRVAPEIINSRPSVETGVKSRTYSIYYDILVVTQTPRLAVNSTGYNSHFILMNEPSLETSQ